MLMNRETSLQLRYMVRSDLKRVEHITELGRQDSLKVLATVFSASQRIIKEWNCLPANIFEAKDMINFEKRSDSQHGNSKFELDYM